MPETTFFVIDKIHGGGLDVGSDGSYDACQAFLRELQEVFGARFSEHLESGICPGNDKEKGYWKVEMFGQDFFIMRHRGFGICIWGPKPPADIKVFLRVAEHFGARERISFAKRVARWLRLTHG